MRLNKDVCQRCRIEKGFGWTDKNEEEWERGWIDCPREYPKEYEWNREVSVSVKRPVKINPPVECYFKMEHMILSQEGKLA